MTSSKEKHHELPGMMVPQSSYSDNNMITHPDADRTGWENENDVNN